MILTTFLITNMYLLKSKSTLIWCHVSNWFARIEYKIIAFAQGLERFQHTNELNKSTPNFRSSTSIKMRFQFNENVQSHWYLIETLTNLCLFRLFYFFPSGTDDECQEYDYLGAWGPRFDKLADMYGPEQELELDDIWM